MWTYRYYCTFHQTISRCQLHANKLTNNMNTTLVADFDSLRLKFVVLRLRLCLVSSVGSHLDASCSLNGRTSTRCDGGRGQRSVIHRFRISKWGKKSKCASSSLFNVGTHVQYNISPSRVFVCAFKCVWRGTLRMFNPFTPKNTMHLNNAFPLLDCNHIILHS